MNRALFYLRRSTKSDSRTISIEDQAQRCLDYWRRYNVDKGGFANEQFNSLVHDGVSGGERKRFEEISAKLNEPHWKFNHLVVYHLDRLGRDLAGTLDFLRKCRRIGVTVHDVLGGGVIDCTKSAGFLLTGTQALIAEHYRVLVGERTSSALGKLKEAGKRWAKNAPYGYRFTVSAGVEEDPAEQVNIQTLMGLVRAGHSPAMVRQKMKERGCLNRNGQSFDRMAIWKILKRGEG